MNRKFSIIILTVSLITLKFPGEIAAENNLRISNKYSALRLKNRPFNHFFYTSAYIDNCNNNIKSSGSKECTDNNSCKSLKHSECSDGSCKCLSGYIKSNNKCYADFGSKCSSDSECASSNSVCLSGTCQCPKTHYFENGGCHEYAEGPGYHVYSAKACQHIQKLIYVDGKCECESSYVEIDRTCRSKLGSKCTEDSDCIIEGNICLSGICQCDSDYHEHGGYCYGFPDAECNTELNCISGSYICQTGTCKVVTKEDSDGNSKCESATSRECSIRLNENFYVDNKFVDAGDDHIVCEKTFQSIFPIERSEYHYNTECNVDKSGPIVNKIHDRVNNGDMEWKSYNDYNLALTVIESMSNNKPSLICQSKATNGVYYIGAFKPPNYNQCHYQIDKKNVVSSPENYQVLQYTR